MIECDQIIVRIEQLKRGFVSREIAVMTPEQAFQLGNDTQNYSIHEIISQKYHKIFFDIDSKSAVNMSQFKWDLNKLLCKNDIYYPLEIYTATCHRKDKWSYHITTNIVVHKKMMIGFARYMAKCGYPIDEAPYGKQDDSMRSLRYLNCVKISDNEQKGSYKIIPNKFVTTFTAEQMAITNKQNCFFVEIPPVFDNDYIFEFDNVIMFQAEQQTIIDEIKAKLPNVVIDKIEGNYIDLEYAENNKQNCVLCGKLHDFGTKKLYGFAYGSRVTIKCWRDETASKKIVIDLITDEEQKENTSKFNKQIAFKQQFLPTQNQKYVSFDFWFESELLAVKSAMGTGKTEQAINIMLEQKSRCIESTIIASARVVYSNNAQQRFNFKKDKNGDFKTPTGLNIQLYNDTKGIIDPSRSMTIVQVESFTRLSDEPFELLILDEWQSIYEQLNSKLHKNPNELHYKFIRLLQQAKRILVLDAQLQPSTLKRLEYYCGRQARIINNIYQPYTDFTFKIHQLQNKNAFDPVLERCADQINQGKKIYSHINSKKKLFMLAKHIEKQGTIARIYHGDNLMSDENNQIHGKIKDTHFKDVSKYFKNYSFVGCNSAMGAGVDFSEDHFDTGIHAFFANTASPMSFVQSLFRSRKFTEKEHHIWIQACENKQSLSTASYFQQFQKNNEQVNKSNTPINDRVFNLQIDLNAYKNAMNSNRANIIISGLKQLGCNVELVEDQYQNDKISKKIVKELPPMKLTVKQLKDTVITPKCVEYFLADPKEKQKMIVNDQLKGDIQQQMQALSLVIVNKQIKNEQLKDEETAFKIITENLSLLQQQSVEEIKREFNIYELSRQYKPYKQAFGVLHQYTKEEAIRTVEQRLEMAITMFKQQVAQKGITPVERYKLQKSIVNALEFYHSPENEKEEVALKLFDYKKKDFKYIYAILGLNYETKYKQQRVNGKNQRILDKETITQLPNANI